MELGVSPKTTLYMIGLIDLCGIKHLNQSINLINLFLSSKVLADVRVRISKYPYMDICAIVTLVCFV